MYIVYYVDLQDRMQYEIIGEYPAPDFFSVNGETGEITVARDLREDSLQLSAYTVISFNY